MNTLLVEAQEQAKKLEKLLELIYYNKSTLNIKNLNESENDSIKSWTSKAFASTIMLGINSYLQE